MVEKIVCPKCGHLIERYKNPLPTADVIVDIDGKVVLVKRKNPPYGWALPGGFINYGESAENTAVREIREETGLEITGLKHTFVGPGIKPGDSPTKSYQFQINPLQVDLVDIGDLKFSAT